MNSSDIRRSFLDFFKKHNHKILKSSSLFPDAPNLLFTNAGMNQFVPIFLGNSKASAPRVANSQKCIRAGGKHNDLDDVGFDTYHHTFFEMLGNWSFGAFFKKEAIEMAWELLTEVWKFPKNRLYATVYSPQPGEPSVFDSESYGFWKDIFLQENMDPGIHIINGSKRDNFWMMGETGPCGPCTEIHIDLTPEGNTKGNLVNTGSPWCIELWNLVFIQFNATNDESFENLKDKHVDTGMGLERIVGIVNKTKNFSDFSQLPSNYDSDLFYDIFHEIERLSNKKYCGSVSHSRERMSEQELIDFWFRAIGDHVRALTFSIADGIFPSNEGRGYVLRRILRRAVMFGNLLHLPHGFFAQLASIVINKMGCVFPEVIAQKTAIEQVLTNEETTFSKTIDRGMAIFKGICNSSAKKISGSDAFLLYDTYGFPLDLTQLMASEAGLTVDTTEFETLMENQRARARSAQKKSAIEISSMEVKKTEFVGYDISNITNIFAKIEAVLKNNEKTFVVFDKTPFYAECGGQVGDKGFITVDDKIFHVVDVQKDRNGCFLHELDGEIGEISAGQFAHLSVDKNIRRNAVRNHSATHLLQAALKKIIGKHINQSGSHVDDKRLRFDFNTITPPTKEQLQEVENIVINKILECVDSNIFVTNMENIPVGCIANFGDKYEDEVRVVELGEFSKELCGGCHVRNTSEIVCFKIISCTAIASGIRRIEAVTGEKAIEIFREHSKILEMQCHDFSCQPEEISEKIATLRQNCKKLEKSVKLAREANLQNMADEIVKCAKKDANGLFFVEKFVENLSPDELRATALKILNDIADGVVILTSEKDEKYSVVVCCSKSAVIAGHNAGNIVKSITEKNNGSGGGRPDFAMGGYVRVIPATSSAGGKREI